MREGSISATPSNNIVEAERPSSSQMGRRDSFGAQFMGSSGLEESSIRSELEQYNSYTPEASGLYESASALPARLTPLMFSRPHTCARISASGLLVKVEPNNPQEGQTATVELHSMAALLRDTKESQELSMFPGPLKPGVTHKNDVIKFCERKIAASKSRADLRDRESYVLLWEMLILLLRQKGQVEGSDLAELLLRDTSDPGDSHHSVLSRSRTSSHRGDRDRMEDGASSASSLVEVELVERTGVDRSLLQVSSQGEDTVARFR